MFGQLYGTWDNSWSPCWYAEIGSRHFQVKLIAPFPFLISCHHNHLEEQPLAWKKNSKQHYTLQHHGIEYTQYRHKNSLHPRPGTCLTSNKLPVQRKILNGDLLVKETNLWVMENSCGASSSEVENSMVCTYQNRKWRITEERTYQKWRIAVSLGH